MEKKSFKSKRSMKEQDLSFKEKFEILTEKYSTIKDIVKQVLKDLNEEKERQMLLRTEYEQLVIEVKEKDALLERMQSVSEAVIDDYSALRVKCDLEVEAATNASKRATKYFQENQKLKESSQHELEDKQTHDSIEPSNQETNPEENVSELDMLNNLASELRTEIASLKVQLMKEIEKQNSLKEDFEIAKDLYENEMKEHNATREKLELLKLDYNGQVNASSEPKSLETFVEQSTKSLKQDQGSFSKDCVNAKNSIDNSHSAAVTLELAEQIDNFKHQNNLLNTRIQELEFENRKLRAEASASMSLPIPPPPPPPPLPPPSFNPIKSLITFIHAGKKSAKAKKENVETEHQKAMSEMIDAIKKGQVHLKPTPKTFPTQSPRNQDFALGEMKSILSTLKKKDKVLKGDECQAIQEAKCLDASFVQEAPVNVSIGSDVDEELKLLLRKRSLKTITDENACEMSVAKIKSNRFNDAPLDHQAECHISKSSDSEFIGGNRNDILLEIIAESDISPLSDTVITSENQNIEDTVK